MPTSKMWEATREDVAMIFAAARGCQRRAFRGDSTSIGESHNDDPDVAGLRCQLSDAWNALLRFQYARYRLKNLSTASLFSGYQAFPRCPPWGYSVI